MILEPSGGSWARLPLRPGFLAGLREVTRRHGTLLDLRRGHHGLPVGAGRCSGAVRRHPRPLDPREDHRRGRPRRGDLWPGGGHAGLRHHRRRLPRPVPPHRPPGHLQRDAADSSGGTRLPQHRGHRRADAPGGCPRRAPPRRPERRAGAPGDPRPRVRGKLRLPHLPRGAGRLAAGVVPRGLPLARRRHAQEHEPGHRAGAPERPPRARHRAPLLQRRHDVGRPRGIGTSTRRWRPSTTWSGSS